jgi:hypothetical protein
MSCRRHVALVGLSLLMTSWVIAQTPAATTSRPPPDLTARLARAADRIASIDAQANRIDAYNQLRNLQRMYGYYYDEALWDQVIDLFAVDATVEVGAHGVYVGSTSRVSCHRSSRSPMTHSPPGRAGAC